ncbi:MAG TPA: hypothetical protein PK956_01665 [Burkholderiaceae bacterium]|jgi:hypothetical protein|nr:hypothetical protein [Burkholderiaceae bacterium]
MSSPPRIAVTEVTIPRRRVFGALIVVTALLALAFVVTHLLKLQGYPEQMGLRRLFNMEDEGTLPAWFSSTLMLAASALLAVIAASSGTHARRFRAHWWVLAIGFLYMSADEASAIHENLNRAGHALPIRTDGLLDTPWVIFGLAIALVVGLAYLKFLAHLSPAIRRGFVLAGACFVGGAVGVEMLVAASAEANGLASQPPGWSHRGDFPAGHMLLLMLEECMEILGVALFIHALLAQIEAETGRVSLGVSS